jgi:hypothetical protein
MPANGRWDLIRRLKVNEHCTSCVKIVCCSSDMIATIFYSGSSIYNASQKVVSCMHLSSVNGVVIPNPQT